MDAATPTTPDGGWPQSRDNKTVIDAGGVRWRSLRGPQQLRWRQVAGFLVLSDEDDVQHVYVVGSDGARHRLPGFSTADSLQGRVRGEQFGGLDALVRQWGGGRRLRFPVELRPAPLARRLGLAGAASLLVVAGLNVWVLTTAAVPADTMLTPLFLLIVVLLGVAAALVLRSAIGLATVTKRELRVRGLGTSVYPLEQVLRFGHSADGGVWRRSYAVVRADGGTRRIWIPGSDHANQMPALNAYLASR